MSGWVLRSASTADTTHVFLSIPDGPRYRGRIREVIGVESYEDQVHPGKPHRWHHLTHYGELGTGFVHCGCGAMAVPFRRRYR